MAIWWTAIDREHCTYEELKHRQVVAQGWRRLGDLSTLRVFLPDMRQEFTTCVQLIGDASYREQGWWAEHDRAPNRAPTAMWNLLSISDGDLVVALEGITVRGLCEVQRGAASSYAHQAAWEYAQTVGFPLKWVDWETQLLGDPPTAPAQSVLGIKSVQKEEALVRRAWEKASR